MVTKLLVKNFEDYFNVAFTAEMETHLDKVEEGELSWVKVVQDFYQPFEISVEKAKLHMENVKKQLEEETDEFCEKCGARFVIRWGRFGKFMACSGFPKCKNSRPLIVETGVGCPLPDCQGNIIERKSKRGRTFYGCSQYPDCKFAVWYRPMPVKCEKCGADFLVEKRKGGSQILECIQEGCDYTTQPAENGMIRDEVLKTGKS